MSFICFYRRLDDLKKATVNVNIGIHTKNILNKG